MASVIPSLLTGLLEQALNRYLALDPDAPLFIRPLAGTVIALRFSGLERVVYLCPTETGIQLLEDCIEEPDTTLTGTPLAFAAMALSDAPMAALFSGAVEMKGDAAVGQKFQRLFEKLDIDWEEWLSQYSGDIIAHKLGNLFRGGRKWGRESLETLQLNIAEYLQEETRELPTRVEANILFDGIDTLRADCDRLEARLRRLDASAASPPEV